MPVELSGKAAAGPVEVVDDWADAVQNRMTPSGPDATDRRRRAVLFAALGFAQLPWHASPPPPINVLKGWLDSWDRLGALVTGMHAQGYDVEMRQLGAHRRARLIP